MKALIKSAFGLMIAVMLLFAAISYLVARNTSRLMVDEARRTVRSVVKNTITQIDQLMVGVETAVANQKWVIKEHLTEPDYMYLITRKLVETNPDIVGSTVAFKPNHFKAKGFYFAPYTCDDGGELRSFQLGTDENRYHEQEWYTKPMKTKRAEWSEPYFDEGGAKILMSTYSIPIFDAGSNVCAIFTADLALDRFANHVASICPYPKSYAAVRSSTGAYVVSPSNERAKGNSGAETFTIIDRADNGWQVEITCPVEEILRGPQQVVIRIICFSAFGLAVIFLVSFVYSSRLQRTTAQRERMAGELNAARDIQAGILSKDFPEFLCAKLVPAREVGGDLYDFIVEDGKLFFIVGDASGKGVPAALFSLIAGTVFRIGCKLRLNAAETLNRINQALVRNNASCMFVTAFVGILDLATGELEYSAAGQNPPVIVAPDGSARFLGVNRQPGCGIVEGFAYRLERATIAKGSKLIAYTDGVTEAERVDHAQYGESRLLDYAKGSLDADVRATTAELFSSIAAFTAGAEQFDDITILAFKL